MVVDRDNGVWVILFFRLNLGLVEGMVIGLSTFTLVPLLSRPVESTSITAAVGAVVDTQEASRSTARSIRLIDSVKPALGLGLSHVVG